MSTTEEVILYYDYGVTARTSRPDDLAHTSYAYADRRLFASV
jgi:hypothetical protein